MELREHILGYLVTPGADTRFGDPYLLRHVAVQASRPQHEVAEALWGLVGDGLAYIDKVDQGSSTDNWRWRASARGIEAATTGRQTHLISCAACVCEEDHDQRPEADMCQRTYA